MRYKNKGFKYILIAALIIVISIFALQNYAVPFVSRYNDTASKEIDPVLVKASKKLDKYSISVHFDAEKKELQCEQYVDYTNRQKVSFEHLFFHLYPNSFKSEDRPAFPPDEMKKAYPNGFSSGYIELESVHVDGNSVKFQAGGYSKDIMVIKLDKPLMPNDTAKIYMKYRIVLPNSIGRFGYGDHTFNIANWYPIACVYDSNGWNTDPYYPIGDPFYSDTANYEVRIIAPKGYIIASTGDILSKKNDGDKTVWDIKALAVRDFAWVASNKFKMSSRIVDGIVINSYYLTKNSGLKALDYAVNAVEVYNKQFGKYPYRQLSIVEADFFIGGMEYPNIILIDHSLYTSISKTWLEMVTVHETAHQWWYGIVGNNEIKEPWLDEGLTEYSTILYYGHRYGKEKQAQMYKDMITEGKYYYLNKYTQGEKIDETIDRPVYKFPDWMIYDILVYGKGTIMFNELNNEIGDKNFYDILKTYYKNNMFLNATKEDFLKACEKVTGKDWSDFLDKWLYDKP